MPNDKKISRDACGEGLPLHSIRVSKRAKRIKLRIVPGKGLEVVLPQRTDPACVPVLLLRHRSWIDKHLSKEGNRPLRQDDTLLVPERVLLKGGREEVRVRSACRPGNDREVPSVSPETASRLLTPPAQRSLVLPQGSPKAALCHLREWLREEARSFLGAMLAQLAVAHGFSYSALSIRFQRSRWGSCSARKAISLNACLLFLPESLIRHILLHELCHTRQLNHSPAFWKELFAVNPDALAHDKALRAAWRYVPSWVFAV